MASAHVLPLFHLPGQLARLTALAVSGEAQGRGVGRALVAAVAPSWWSIAWGGRITQDQNTARAR